MNKTPAEIRKDVDRYYQLTNVYLSVKLFLEELGESDFEFEGSEVDLERKESGNPLSPDILLQYNSDNIIGFPIELKRSLSDDRNVEEELKSMERYDQELVGFNTDDGRVDSHFAVFCPHYLDKNQVKRVLEESDVEFENHELLLWEWNIIQSSKYGDSDEVVSIRLIDSDVNIDIEDKFIEIIKEEGMRYSMNETKFVINKDKTLFVREKPPVAYTIIILWNTVLRSLDSVEFTAEDVRDKIHENYTENLMENVDGNPFRVKKSWIEKALNKMVDLGLAEQPEENKYKANLGKHIEKKFVDYLSEKLGNEEADKHKPIGQ